MCLYATIYTFKVRQRNERPRRPATRGSGAQVVLEGNWRWSQKLGAQRTDSWSWQVVKRCGKAAKSVGVSTRCFFCFHVVCLVCLGCSRHLRDVVDVGQQPRCWLPSLRFIFYLAGAVMIQSAASTLSVTIVDLSDCTEGQLQGEG